MEDTIRREYERWMVADEQESAPPNDRDADDGEADDVGSPRRGGTA